ncbi:hypothetical protein FB382_004073 [Nocardioides ginsengisegetis]|uniref:Uncharacterized protein n=1 Tax=Nocardioides ginsengisegetis TaxID=661491 RepID=A0A7W3J3N4_9ACTN|nr:hypothetical protein [Nocardioides ginsengisegetis]MBA8805728.1 hypothetical protein [Nocardioides ginsengisegetis]
MDAQGMKPGYNVWFGLWHITATGFQHRGRRENCARCNPSVRPDVSRPS